MEEQGKKSREAVIVRTSIIGIIANAVLAALKALIGTITGSIAIILDAVNNFTDMVSSIVAIGGTKLAAKRPDRKHPMGYGRIEYLGSLSIAGLILYAGITAVVESVDKIIHPTPVEYTTVSLIILAAAVIVKLLLGRYVKAQGKKVDADALVASGTEAMFDAIMSTSVLACALLNRFTGINAEPYLGVVISLMIIKTSTEMLLKTVNDLIGIRSDPELVRAVKRSVKSVPNVRGAYDVVLNSYGPSRVYGSLHIEVPDTMTVDELDRLTRQIEKTVLKDTGVNLTGVGIYAKNTHDEAIIEMRNEVYRIATRHEWAIGAHGFYVDIEKKEMRFDTVVSFDKQFDEAEAEITAEVKAAFPGYEVFVGADADIS